jgi:hypothetical protein
MSDRRSNGAYPNGEAPGDQLRNLQADAENRPDEQDKQAYDHSRFPDNFYRGLITFLDRVRGRGVIRSTSGREVGFEFPFVTVVGAELGGHAPGIELLRQGDSVGFDVGWTSRGLRVTKINPARERTDPRDE